MQKTKDSSTPLRVDLDDRPRQLVCYEHGKPALKPSGKLLRAMKLKPVSIFIPLPVVPTNFGYTPHTHWASTSIIGDDPYGTKHAPAPACSLDFIQTSVQPGANGNRSTRAPLSIERVLEILFKTRNFYTQPLQNLSG
ncbi:MAG: hypothetical protein R2792_05775 [Saprospiraceae bacterium]